MYSLLYRAKKSNAKNCIYSLIYLSFYCYYFDTWHQHKLRFISTQQIKNQMKERIKRKFNRDMNCPDADFRSWHEVYPTVSSKKIITFERIVLFHVFTTSRCYPHLFPIYHFHKLDFKINSTSFDLIYTSHFIPLFSTWCLSSIFPRFNAKFIPCKFVLDICSLGNGYIPDKLELKHTGVIILQSLLRVYTGFYPCKLMYFTSF